MDQVIAFLVTLPIYVGICLVIAGVFFLADRRVRNYLRRPLRCEACSAQVDTGVMVKHRGKCPSCGHVQAAWAKAAAEAQAAREAKAARTKKS